MSITRPKGVRTEKLQVKADTLRKEKGEITLNQRHKSQKKREKKTQKLEQITNHDKNLNAYYLQETAFKVHTHRC